jgi:hypothetical protein
MEEALGLQFLAQILFSSLAIRACSFAPGEK